MCLLSILQTRIQQIRHIKKCDHIRESKSKIDDYDSTTSCRMSLPLQIQIQIFVVISIFYLQIYPDDVHQQKTERR